MLDTYGIGLPLVSCCQLHLYKNVVLDQKNYGTILLEKGRAGPVMPCKGLSRFPGSPEKSRCNTHIKIRQKASYIRGQGHIFFHIYRIQQKGKGRKRLDTTKNLIWILMLCKISNLLSGH